MQGSFDTPIEARVVLQQQHKQADAGKAALAPAAADTEMADAPEDGEEAEEGALPEAEAPAGGEAAAASATAAEVCIPAVAALLDRLVILHDWSQNNVWEDEVGKLAAA